MAQQDTLGITASKEKDFSEWYTQVITRSELIDYSLVSGSYIIKPSAYNVWENIQAFINDKIKQLGVSNIYFPMLIPESLLKKEAKHIAGFSPEVAWVTEAGNSKLNERLAIRPTSETIMYEAYARWIRSYKDLPLKLNQWVNIVRWEFKNPVPFLRSREFLWQEGHTAFATKEEADKEVLEVLDVYADLYEEILAVPVIKGKKTESEKFAGADYTTSLETFLPNGRGIQCATSHSLGQNFSKSFEIKFIDKDEKEKNVWQNSWGLSTRSIGITIMQHSDNKGAVIPPRVAKNKAVIIPIFFKDEKRAIVEKCKSLLSELSGFNPILDDREGYTPGWKFNEWELKGIPLRIELGPKDLKEAQVVLVRRDNQKKETIKIKSLKKKVQETLEEIQTDLLSKARKHLKDSTVEAKNLKELIQAINDKKLVKAGWCGDSKCEETIKEKADGAKILCIPFKKHDITSCVACNKKAKEPIYIAKSY